jgi:hypothetical protein
MGITGLSDDLTKTFIQHLHLKYIIMKIYSLIILLVFIGLSCKTQNKQKDFDYGRLENNKYVNEYFDFEMMVPINWVVQSKEQNTLETGKNLVAGEDANMKAVFKASEINTANLLSVYQYPKSAAVEYNPSILILAESLKDSPDIRKGSEYLFHARQMMIQSQFKYDYLDEEFEKEIISGIDFYKMNSEVKYMGLIVKQVYYTAVLKGFSLSIIISFVNENQNEEILNSIKSIKIEN